MSDAFLLIANPRSGTAPDMAVLRTALEKHGLHGEIVDVSDSMPAEKHAARGVTEGIRIIIAAGGDGTISAVAAAITGSSSTLGVLPVGTLNHFARDLGISMDLDAAIAVIAAGQTRLVDMGMVNDRPFLNNISVGLYPELVRIREAHRGEIVGGRSRAIVHALWQTARHYPFMHVRLSGVNDASVRTTPFVFVGNNRYSLGGIDPAHRARLDEGLLIVCTAERPGPLSLFRLALRTLAGRLARAKDVDLQTVKNVRIETRRRMEDIAVDGEIVRVTMPLECRILPRVLSVFAPA